MKNKIRIGMLSTIFLSAFLMAVTVESDFSRAQINATTKTSAAAEIKTGEWIGHIVVDKISAENCSIEFENIKAHFSNRQMVVSFRNNKTDIKLNLSLDKKNAFSVWHELSLQLFDLVKTYEREFKISGDIKGNILDGSFFADVTRVGDTCGGDIYFVKKGTAEATAYLAQENPQLASLEQKPPPQPKIANVEPKKPSKQTSTVPQVAKNPNADLEKAVAELMRFRKMQKAEQAKLAKLQKAADAQARELAALKLAQKKSEQKARAKAKKAALELLKKEKDFRVSIRPQYGSYHALIIGINKYKNLPRLKTAVADAKAIASILKRDYGFKVSTLINPTREVILNALDELRDRLVFNDNLLIYYSGHGWLDTKADEGYWLPVNAKSDRRSKWLSNNTLTAALRAFEAKHVMVVADSCYSGRLTRGISVRPRASLKLDLLKKLARKKARVVMTSGGLKPVDDDNGSGHSPFAENLLKALKRNKGVFDGTSLFKSIRRSVMTETRDQEPQYSDVRRAGHDGGDFIFVKR